MTKYNMYVAMVLIVAVVLAVSIWFWFDHKIEQLEQREYLQTEIK